MIGTFLFAALIASILTFIIDFFLEYDIVWPGNDDDWWY